MKNAILTLSILVLWSPWAAAATTWEVAPGPSSVKFKVQHMIFSEVEGRFKKIEGKVITPGSNLEHAQMEARIPVTSIYTGIQDRDNNLRGQEFFFSKKFPDIIFKSRDVVKTADNTYIIKGDLTMRGVTKPVELTATCANKHELANGKTRMDLIAKGKLSRYDYGLKWNEMMETGKALVGEEVDIDLKIALMKDATGA